METDTLATLADHVHATSNQREASSIGRAVARNLADALADLAARPAYELHLADALSAHYTPSTATVARARDVCEAWRSARNRHLSEAVSAAPTVARIADALAAMYRRDAVATQAAVRAIRTHRYADKTGAVGTADATDELNAVARRLYETSDAYRDTAIEAGALDAQLG